MILSIDLGTTLWKAALIDENGAFAAKTALGTPEVSEDGHPVYDSGSLKQTLSGLVSGLGAEKLRSVRLIALSGMAEAGLLADRYSLKPLTSIWPWFDTRTLPLFESLKHKAPFADRARVTGLPDSHKYGIYKLLTLLSLSKADPKRTVWMSLVSYAASILTGACAEDVSIAARTGCLRLDTLSWDEDFLDRIGLSSANFPALSAHGAAVGCLKSDFCGVPAGTPVALGGHDHLCAAASTDDMKNGGMFLSCGTAQVLLKAARGYEAESGLSYGPGSNDLYAVLGSVQSAGGSVNLFCRLLYPGQDYETLLKEASEADYPPLLTYYPYLAGSGAPHIDPLARAAVLGMTSETERRDIICAVYAGVALETRYIAESLLYDPALPICCIGGLTRHERYMQTLADVLGTHIRVPAESEGTLYGAARLCAEVTGAADLGPLKTQKDYAPSRKLAAYWDGAYRDYVTTLRRLYDR
ncbi:MAG: hypothetical protein IKR85_06930 [Clostridia bacterium]|nr:hypothetical protein [Clostridia bacterium]